MVQAGNQDTPKAMFLGKNVLLTDMPNVNLTSVWPVHPMALNALSVGSTLDACRKGGHLGRVRAGSVTGPESVSLWLKE